MLGLQIGLTPEALGRTYSSTIFTRYKSLHSRMLLSKFFPWLKKGLMRIERSDLYDDIYTQYESTINRQSVRKQRTAGGSRKKPPAKVKKDVKLATDTDAEEATTSSATSLGQVWFSESLSVPAPVLHHIFCYLDLKQLAICRAVSRTFRDSLDDLQLHSKHPLITRYAGTDYSLQNKGREMIKGKPWLQQLESKLELDKVLTARGIHPEIIRRCRKDPFLLTKVLAATGQVYQLASLKLDNRKLLCIHTIRVGSLLSQNNTPATALALGDKRMFFLQTGLPGTPLKLARSLMVDTHKHGMWQGTGLFRDFQHEAVALHTKQKTGQTFLTTGYSHYLNLWDFSRPGRECLVGCCQLAGYVSFMVIIENEAGYFLITRNSFGLPEVELTVWSISTTGPVEAFHKKISSFKPGDNISQLLPLSRRNWLAGLGDSFTDNAPVLILWELDSKQQLRQLHRRKAFEPERHCHSISMSIAQCGEKILTLMPYREVTGWSLDIETRLFIVRDIIDLRWPDKMYTRLLDLLVFSSDRFAVMQGNQLFIFKIPRDGKPEGCQHMVLDKDRKINTPQSAAVVNQDLMLLSDFDGKVSLWLVPE